MIEILNEIDKTLFIFCNSIIANGLFDSVMPFITDLNKTWIGWVIFLSLWMLLILKGGRRGVITAIMLIPLLTMSDQMSSAVLKPIFEKPRPCREVDGVLIIEQLRLLVPCGSGYSFPSSHATNNFAVAVLLGYFYKRWLLIFLSIATLVGFSRIYVGVHYPSDILGGAIVGTICALIFIMLLKYLSKYFAILQLPERNSK